MNTPPTDGDDPQDGEAVQLDLLDFLADLHA